MSVAVKVTCWLIGGALALDLSAIVIAASFTIWFSAGDVLVNEDASPSYTAIIELVPVARFTVVKVATPLVSVPDPIAFDPFSKVTVPVGVTPGEDTVAVNVTGCS